MATDEELQKKIQLAARILDRHKYHLHAESGRYRIGSPPVVFSDFSTPLLYSLAGVLLALAAFWSVGPLEGVVIGAVTLLGFVYTGLLYWQKVNLSKTVVEITPEGILLLRPRLGEQFVSRSSIRPLLVVLDPEEKVKTGSLVMVSEETGEVELVKFIGEKQRYIKDDLEKVRDFIAWVLASGT
jgi:hypothetical protein